MIREIELHSLDAIPALQSTDYDGWILRQAKGHTKRANSVNFRDPGVIPVQEKIDYCERFYADLKQPSIFRLTPLMTPENLDEILDARGYAKLDETDVYLRDLGKHPPKASSHQVLLNTEMTEDWLEAMARLTGLSSKGQSHLSQMMAVTPLESIFASIKLEGQIIACGLGGASKTTIGLFEFATDPHHQRKGCAKAIVDSLLTEASKKNVGKAYIQVVQDNKEGQNFWNFMGFDQKLYRYHYRVKK